MRKAYCPPFHNLQRTAHKNLQHRDGDFQGIRIRRAIKLCVRLGIRMFSERLANGKARIWGSRVGGQAPDDTLPVNPGDEIDFRLGILRKGR